MNDSRPTEATSRPRSAGGIAKKPIGNWIQTVSGGMVFPTAPDPREINLEDIAHSLAMQCRFNGHCREFYSVAQHSVIVSRHCHRFPLLGLMHDAAEAYVGDIVRPIKLQIKAFSELEQTVWRSIAAMFGLPMRASAAARDEVLRMDAAVLATELRDLMAPPPWPWAGNQKPLEEVIVPVEWREAKRMFLDRFRLLTEEPLPGPRRTNEENQVDPRAQPASQI